ncbi:endonuclease/exonuclease/phosphatase family protein [Paracoccus caeni]|uniref:Endonuclease/exonuclease/phosphatase family protein n=1 Tax=Paracoccus caeni TaxID=657651 RepID=A0A934SCV8_9RHOB|nr:endonuclease/exonuclease/phosphatase family protein [Paracoccus caeni]MBK4215004.1 endonuclease/exonuclease/phosphatase family protein [Paracoccus caeni]
MLAAPAAAEPIRIATYDPGLSRKGPGLLLQDIRDRDPQVLAAAEVIAAAAPDVILLTDFDWDLQGQALSAFVDLLDETGHPMRFFFAGRPNSGMATGLDLNGDGRTGRADDAQGFGQFTGQGGMAVLSNLPLGEIRDYSDLLWHELPDNLMPVTPPEIAAIQRLSSTAHWDVTVITPDGPLHLIAWAATPPVFDGPEDRNGRRNHDETAFWLTHLPAAPFVALGKINLDPDKGDGLPDALHRLMAHVHDPQPIRPDASRDDALTTAIFAQPGNLRVDYVLPATALQVIDSQILSPLPDDPLAATVAAASNHRLVWVEVDLPRAQAAR